MELSRYTFEVGGAWGLRIVITEEIPDGEEA